jgi:acetolactate synthase-1/2/3 large subunit
MINLYEFIDALSNICTPEDVIIPSSAGFASEVTQQAWKVKKGQRVICNPGLGSMGFAIPHAIGAAIASNRRVICIEGDGSLQHNIQELQTISRLNLNIKIFVINNGGYASIRNTHNKFFGNNPVDELSFPDLGCLFWFGYGIKCTDNIFRKVDLKDIIEVCLEENVCAMCEVMIDPDQKKELEI